MFFPGSGPELLGATARGRGRPRRELWGSDLLLSAWKLACDHALRFGAPEGPVEYTQAHCPPRLAVKVKSAPRG